jgi:transcriptional regulator NrdR family protein
MSKVSKLTNEKIESGRILSSIARERRNGWVYYVDYLIENVSYNITWSQREELTSTEFLREVYRRLLELDEIEYVAPPVPTLPKFADLVDTSLDSSLAPKSR